jgi:hypothetical protein
MRRQYQSEPQGPPREGDPTADKNFNRHNGFTLSVDWNAITNMLLKFVLCPRRHRDRTGLDGLPSFRKAVHIHNRS